MGLTHKSFCGNSIKFLSATAGHKCRQKILMLKKNFLLENSYLNFFQTKKMSQWYYCLFSKKSRWQKRSAKGEEKRVFRKGEREQKGAGHNNLQEN